MFDKLIAYLEQQEQYMERMETHQARHIFFDHAFGAVDFVYQNTADEDAQTDLARLWEEWKSRLEEKVYGV